MRVRRIVTGSVDGRSAVVDDHVQEPIEISTMPGREFFTIWASDAPARLPSSGEPPTSTQWFPPPGGFRFGFTVIPPAGGLTASDEGTEHDLDEIRRKLPGLLDPYDPDTPGMHATDTIDFIFLVEGELTLEMDDDSVHLSAGDCVVQNGTRHRWRNSSGRRCVIAYALVGAARDGDEPPH